MHLPVGPQPGAEVFGLLMRVSPVGFQVLGAKTGGSLFKLHSQSAA